MRDIIIIVAAVVSAPAVAALYVRTRGRRWRRILDEALSYHRHHFIMLQNEQDVGTESKEMARSFLMVIDRQFREERKRGLGLSGLFFDRFGNKSTLNSMDELFMKLFRDRYFGRSSVFDERLERLYFTLSSTIHRLYSLSSIAKLPALLYMDMVLVLARADIARSGSSRLYRDIARAID
jgi:hypothetical protein